MNEKHITRLIAAALAYARIAEAHRDHQEHRTKAMQEAANLARKGQQKEANQILSSLQLGATSVFDYADVHDDLIRAVKPFRPKSKT